MNMFQIFFKEENGENAKNYEPQTFDFQYFQTLFKPYI